MKTHGGPRLVVVARLRFVVAPLTRLRCGFLAHSPYLQTLLLILPDEVDFSGIQTAEMCTSSGNSLERQRLRLADVLEGK